MNKEKWINAVMDSTRGIQPALPPADLYNRIATRINSPKEHQPLTISFPTKKWAAAAVLLLALNIGSVFYYIGESKKATTSTRTTTLSEDIQPESTYNY